MLKVGVVGMGGMGNARLRVAKHNPHVSVVACCDSDESRRTDAETRHGIRAFADVDAMFDAEPLDILVVTTPDFAHREPVIMAAEQGCHVLVEKPLATTVEDAEAMVEAVRKAGVKCHICFQNRFTPQFVVAKRAVDEGKIGSFLSLISRCNAGRPGQRWAGETTVAWFLLSHSIDLGMWITGHRPRQVYATGVRKKLIGSGILTYDIIHAVITNDDGTDAMYEGSWVLPDAHPGWVFDYEITGTEGSLRALRPLGIDLISDRHRQVSAEYVSLADEVVGMHVDMFDMFVRSILNDRPPLVPMEDGLLNTRILVALHRSLETGRPEPV